MHVILYVKYEKAYLHKVVETQCQNLTTKQRNDSLKLLQNSKSCFMEHLEPGKEI